jgi:hypothetical protein
VGVEEVEVEAADSLPTFTHFGREKEAMVRCIRRDKRNSWPKRCGAILIAAAFTSLVISGPSLAATVKQRTFSSPEEAVKALVEAVKSNDVKALEAIFGPGSHDLVVSGDPVADQSGRERFLQLYNEKNKFEQTADRAILCVGNEDWPSPIPIVKKGGVWFFDAKQGWEEILARRIGKNELSAIQVCLAYVDAQREYALKDRNGDDLLEYAQKFRSDPGKKNGLYWEAKAGEEQSPLGPLVAAAQEKGYTVKQSGGKPAPYYGYYYRILTAQGKSAPGGAYGYVVKGKMIGGFALVAYPSKYGSSGVMTFIVNQDGVVYQKDLGRSTGKTAQALKLFNPDSTWEKVK